MAHPAALAVETLRAECDVCRTRGSGPGGQHRNKVETAIVLTHRPTGIVAEATERRSQAENLAVATFRLRLRLAVEVRSAGWLQPSQLWASRVVAERIRVNPEHDDFPALVAEALDAIAACEGELAAAATRLGVTSSQLVKFLKCETTALAKLNADRSARGERPLR